MTPSKDTIHRDQVGRRLAVGFGSVTITAIIMCGLLLWQLGAVSSVVTQMRGDETAIRASLSLAMAVREQYIHQAHWLIEGDNEHLEHSENWLAEVSQSVELLRPLVPSDEISRLEGIAQDSQRLDRMFRTVIRPAASRNERQTVAREHHRAQEISQHASENADRLARTVERRMARSHQRANVATKTGLIVGVLCVLLILSLAVGHTLRLRKAVLRPLAELSAAARRFGQGQFHERLGEIGDGELNAVATAFDRMAAELEAREQRLIATERMAAIGQLAAGVAHEINNPIGIIRGYIKTMLPESDSAILAEELAILDEEAAACQRIAEDLVTFSRVPQLTWVTVPIETLINTAVRRFSETPPSDGVVLRTYIEPMNLSLDAGRIRQVLLNLLNNAAQASGEDARVEIRGAKTEDGKAYRIDVLDRGPGVPDDEKEKVFEPFYSRRQGGSGLGLAVCKGISLAHHGQLTVLAREGGGAIFRLLLPLGASAKAGPTARSSNPLGAPISEDSI